MSPWKSHSCNAVGVRLYYNVHRPDRRLKMIGQVPADSTQSGSGEASTVLSVVPAPAAASPWYVSVLQVYNACVVTVVLAMMMAKKKK